MSDNKHPFQQRLEGGIELGPTTRNFRIVGSGRQWQIIAVSDHFVDVNIMVDLGVGCRFEVVDV